MDAATVTLFFRDPKLTAFNRNQPDFLVHYNEQIEFAYIKDPYIAFEENYGDVPHYWKGKGAELDRFIKNAIRFHRDGDAIAERSLLVRSEIIDIANNVQRFGESVISIINNTSAETKRVDHLSQFEIDQFDASLLSVEDICQRNSLSSHMEALQTTTSTAFNRVSAFQNTVSEFKHFVVNDLRPYVEGPINQAFPKTAPLLEAVREEIRQATKEENTEKLIEAESREKLLLEQREEEASPRNHTRIMSPLISLVVCGWYLGLSESVARADPAIVKFEKLWIETSSFIQNAQRNTDQITNIKMLKVFKVTMQNIMNDWASVKVLLGSI